MDNAGENQLLEARANSVDWKFNITPKYTGRNSPQQNHLVEHGLHTIANRGRAMMDDANIPYTERYKVAGDTFTMATLLDGLMVKTINGITDTRYVHFCGENLAFAQHLRIFGEAGTMTLKTQLTPKIENRGETCMFIGYALNHTGDTYRMWNPVNGQVYTTRDITCPVG